LAKKLSVWFGKIAHIKDITLSPLFDGGKKKALEKKKQKKMRVGRYLLICFGFFLSSEHSIKQGRKKRKKG
jgi:hypothetical protein